MAVGGDFNVDNHLPVAASMNEAHKLMIDYQNGDNIAVHLGTSDATDKSGDSELQEVGCSDFGLETRVMPECGGAQQLINVGELGRSNEDVNLSDSLNVAPILKKVLLCVHVRFGTFNCIISIFILAPACCKVLVSSTFGR